MYLKNVYNHYGFNLNDGTKLIVINIQLKLTTISLWLRLPLEVK